jgi:hypothetical protein
MARPPACGVGLDHRDHVFEVYFGLELLAEGGRRRRLEEAFARALEED